MRHLYNVAAWVTFALSSATLASSFAGLAYWVFNGLGAVQQEIVATAIGARGGAPAGSRVQVRANEAASDARGVPQSCI